MKKNPLAIFTLLLLLGTNMPVFSMWGAVDDDDDKADHATIQRQLTDLRPLEAELKDDVLSISLKEDNQVALGIALSRSPELLSHYDVHLDYFAPLSQDHLPLLRCLNKMVSLKLYNQTLDVPKGSTLSEILSHHLTLTTLDFSRDQGFQLTDDGLIAIQQSINALPHLKTLTLKGQDALSDNGISTLSNIVPNITSIKELDLSSMKLEPRGESQVLSQFSRLVHLRKVDVSNNNLEGDFLIALRHLPNLTELDVSHNQITGRKLRALPRFISRDALNILDISYNQIDDEGLSHISTLPNLTTLNVSNNIITDEGVNELTYLENLTILKANNNNLSERGITFLFTLPATEEQEAVKECCKTGMRFYSGNGVEKNYEKAMIYFRKAADYNHGGAQHFIGQMYKYGHGVEKDEAIAVDWLIKSDNQKCPLAYNMLQQMMNDELKRMKLLQKGFSSRCVCWECGMHAQPANPSEWINREKIWVIEYEGVNVDARRFPRHIQKIAYHFGGIPFVPE